MKSHHSNLLTINVEDTGSEIIITWLGKSVDREPAAFVIPILTDALSQAAADKKLIIDFCNLEFMNSSTITPISKIMEAAKKGQSKLQILYTKSINWQELSFSALKIFETKDQRIEISGR